MLDMHITWRGVIKALCILLVFCAVVGVIAYSSFLIAKEMERKEAYESEIEELIIQRADLNQQYTHAEDTVKERYEDIPNSNITLLFLGIESEIYTEVYPFIAEKSSVVKGTLCLTAQAMPGDEGCITLLQLDEMLNNGWSLALLFDGSGQEELGAFLSQVRQRLASLDMETPDTLAFKPGSYSPSLDDFIIQEGFRHAIHNAEEQTPRIDKTVDGELFHPGAVGWRADKMQRNFMAELMQFGGCACFSIDLSGDKAESNLDMQNDSLVASFSSMIEAIDGWVEDGYCTAKDVGFGLNSRKVYLGIFEIIDRETAELRQELQKQLDEIEIQLAAIYEKYR